MRIILLLIALLLPLAAPAASPGQRAYDEGAAAYKRGDYTLAAAAFHKATVLDPAMLRAWEGLGWAWHRLGRDDDARRVWSTLLKIEPDHPEIHAELGAIARRQGRLAQALEHYRRSLALDPERHHLHLLIGDIHLDRGEDAAAVAAYRRAAERPALREKAQRRIADLFEGAGQWRRVVDYLEAERAAGRAGAALMRHLARLYDDRARAAYEAGRWEEAARLYRRAAAVAPEPAAHLAGLGWALRRQGWLEEAIDAWRRAVDGVEEESGLTVAIADAYRDLGRHGEAARWYRKSDSSTARFRLVEQALAAGDRAGAEWWGRRLLESEVTRASWAGRLARLYIERERPEWGIDLFRSLGAGEEALRRAVAPLYAARGRRAQQAGEYHEAERYYRQALRFDPGAREVLRDLGWVYWHLERWGDCAATWERLIRLDPADPLPHDLLTQFHLERGDHTMAIAHARRSLELAPGRPRQRLRLARAYYLDGRFDQARALAAELARDHPDDLPIQRFQAELASRYRDHRAARDQWAVVLRLDPESARARKKWLLARYALGEYEAALAGLKGWLERHGPDEEILHLLAADARARGDLEEAASWFEKLVEQWPERLGYWLDLAQTQRQRGALEAAHATLVRAGWFHDGEIEIEQRLATNLSARGRFDEAIDRFRALQRRAPHHRPSFVGLVHALIGAGRHRQALELLDDPRALRFWKGYEVELLRASILTAMGRADEAEALHRAIEAPRWRYVPILLYHGIGTNARDGDRLHINRFERQMAALKEAGYTALTVTELVALLEGEGVWPERPILITFDDARRDSFEMADPVLARHGLKATMFVSTAEIRDGHPFHMDWAGMRRYRDSGRWDFQSHGHRAHRRIPVDGEGERGSFLVNRMWLAGEGRLETEAEYRRRLERDYRDSIAILKRELGGDPALVYAFPYSETGQQHLGNAPEAHRLNHELVARLFRFGAIQDQSGYNRFGPAGEGETMLRRFNVPVEMEAQALLDLLRQRHPRARARLARAKSLYWRGEVARAERLLIDLEARDGAPAPVLHRFLAAVAERQGRLRHARLELDRALAAATGPDPALRRLERRLAWRLDPVARLDGRRRDDSNDRTVSTLVAGYGWALPGNARMALEAGRFTFEEAGFGRIEGAQIGLALVRGGEAGWRFGGRLRQRRGDGADPLFLGLEMRHRGGLDFDLALSRGEVETPRAVAAGIDRNRLLLRLGGRLGQRWYLRLGLERRAYDDGNRRRDGRLDLRYAPPAWGGWHGALVLRRADSDASSPLYYAPQALRQIEGAIGHRHHGGGLTARFEAALGWAEGDGLEGRLTRRIEGALERHLGRRWRLGGRVLLSDTSSYRATTFGLSLARRF